MEGKKKDWRAGGNHNSIATCTTSLLEIINYNVEISLFDHEVA